MKRLILIEIDFPDGIDDVVESNVEDLVDTLDRVVALTGWGSCVITAPQGASAGLSAMIDVAYNLDAVSGGVLGRAQALAADLRDTGMGES